MKSYLEDLLLFKIIDAGMPKPRRNYIFHPVRKWEIDFAWPLIKLAVEVEGAVYARGRHTRGKGYTEDCEKYTEASLLGWRLIRVTKEHIDNGKAMEWIRRGIGQSKTDILFEEED